MNTNRNLKRFMNDLQRQFSNYTPIRYIFIHCLPITGTNEHNMKKGTINIYYECFGVLITLIKEIYDSYKSQIREYLQIEMHRCTLYI